jgi:hypothetical protein
MNFSKKLLPCLVPHIGIKFRNPDQGWKFWLAYGDQKKVLMLEKCTQTKVRLMAKLHHVDLFEPMKVIEEKINGMVK